MTANLFSDLPEPETAGNPTDGEPLGSLVADFRSETDTDGAAPPATPSQSGPNETEDETGQRLRAAREAAQRDVQRLTDRR